VLAPSGGFTSFLRTRWGLHKDREASDLHHAQDACVIAAATPALIKRVSDYNRKRETLEILPGGAIVDKTTGEITKNAKAHFPEPWSHFRDEVLARLSHDPAKAVALVSTAYDEEVLSHLRPVLVSRAVKRRGVGAVHQDTVRSVKSHLGPQTSSKRTRLTDLNLAKLDQIVGAQDGRNAGLMHVLRARLETHGGDGKKAFAPSQPPVFKPRRDGTDGPIIRTVQISGTQNTGLRIARGVVDLGEMTAVDVYRNGESNELFGDYAAPVAQRFGGAQPSGTSIHCFRIQKNDLLRVVFKKDTWFGYFVMYESDGRVTLRKHDQPRVDKKVPEFSYFRKSVANAVAIDLLRVDVLGTVFRASSTNDLA
jgi:CRISPR-associated endonuclease Csn1